MKSVRFILVLLGGIAFAGFLWLMLSPVPDESKTRKSGFIPGVDTPRNRHDADMPRAIEEANFDPRFITLRSLDRARLPIADRFDSPLGSGDGAFAYDAQPFGEQNDKRGGRHNGQDLNGIGGENTDEGDPVYASGRGMVVYTGTPSPDWGKVVVLAHRLPDGEIVQTLYAHLKSYRVVLRQIVPRGEKLGEVGSAEGLYFAHLHYEAIRSTTNEAGAPGYFKERTNRMDPSLLGQKNEEKKRSSQTDDIFSILERLERERNQGNMQFRIGPGPDGEGQ